MNPADLGRARAAPMTAQRQATILYIGRPSTTADMLRGLLEKIYAPANGAPLMELVTSQKMALRAIHAQPPLLLLVETTGKPESRLRFCQAVRLRLPGAPIVAVGVHAAHTYTFGFDGVVRTPVEPAQALAVLQRIPALPPAETIRRGPIVLDPAARRVQSPQGEHALTPKLCTLLHLLMENAGRVVRRADIMRRVWETSYLEDTRTLDVHIRWLRQMIEPDPASPVYLLTRRGEGYLFTAPDEGSIR